MRALQGESGAFTYAVSEFLRIHHVVPHRHIFYRHVPELRHDCKTPNGLPVQVQILGGDAGRMAEAAAVAHECGATAIDINFGCPARTVNRHDGGATLLQYPKRIREIVRAIRDALPAKVPVSAKLRLGWDSVEPIFENAAMAAEGGASWLTIHARTRLAGYAPPVHWTLIGRVREMFDIPIIANGDIWTIEDFRRCRDETGCRHFMLGRGALADPQLSHRVAAELGIAPVHCPLIDEDWITRLRRLVDWTRDLNASQTNGAIFRIKQWLNLASTFGKFTGFASIKRARTLDELFAGLQQVA